MPKSTRNQDAYKALLKKFTKACIAEMAGVSRQALTKWETVPGARVAKISEASGLSADEIRPEPYAED